MSPAAIRSTEPRSFVAHPDERCWRSLAPPPRLAFHLTLAFQDRAIRTEPARLGSAEGARAHTTPKKKLITGSNHEAIGPQHSTCSEGECEYVKRSTDREVLQSVSSSDSRTSPSPPLLPPCDPSTSLKNFHVALRSFGRSGRHVVDWRETSLDTIMVCYMTSFLQNAVRLAVRLIGLEEDSRRQ